MAERLASAEALEQRLADEMAQASERVDSLQQQHAALVDERNAHRILLRAARAASRGTSQGKAAPRKNRRPRSKANGNRRARARRRSKKHCAASRQSLDELRAERSQRQIEKARNDADRDYLRQTCVAELNAQPEELIARRNRQLLVGEDLVAAETNYNEMKARVEAMGPVNMMALEEFQECEQREKFLRRERDDLVQSIQNTQLTINELDEVSRQKFEEAFTFINAQLRGRVPIALRRRPRRDAPQRARQLGRMPASTSSRSRPGKRLQNILLLSGGEKALTALALLIAVFRYRPSPFCILDEVDAPLDEANVGRFNRMLAEMCGQTQFIVVTHNRKTMEMGSVLYGVTMQEPGVSKLVSVKWEEDAAACRARSRRAASNAA